MHHYSSHGWGVLKDKIPGEIKVGNWEFRVWAECFLCLLIPDTSFGFTLSDVPSDCGFSTKGIIKGNKARVNSL